MNGALPQFESSASAWSDEQLHAAVNWVYASGQFNRLVSLAQNLGLSAEDAADVVQGKIGELGTKNYAVLRTYDPSRYTRSECPFSNWLTYIIRNAKTRAGTRNSNRKRSEEGYAKAHSNPVTDATETPHDDSDQLALLDRKVLELLVEKDLADGAEGIRKPDSGKERSKNSRKREKARELLVRDDTILARFANFEARGVTADEFDEFWRLDSHAYADLDAAAYAAAMREVLRGWLTSYPMGLVGLYRAGELYGGLGCWPLTAETASALVAGRLKESDIAGTEMAQFRTTATPYWYFGGLFVGASRRGAEGLLAGAALLANGINRWVINCRHSMRFPLEMTAFGASPEGIRVLNRCGFQPHLSAAETAERLPLYRRTVEEEEFRPLQLDGIVELMQTFSVRPMRSADMRHVRDVFTECFVAEYISHAEIQEGRATPDGQPLAAATDLLAAELPRLMADFPDGVLVAEANGRVIGFVVSQIRDLGAGPFCVINDLCVALSFRRSGGARRLVEAVFAACRAQSIDQVFLESGINNASAHGLFHQLGFRSVSHVFLKRL